MSKSKSNSQKMGVCKKCGIMGVVEEHHPLPVVHFKGIGGKVSLCYDCHLMADKLAIGAEFYAFPYKRKLDRRNRKLTKWEYLTIFRKFLKGE